MFRFQALLCSALAATVLGWEDCDVSPIDAKGTYETAFVDTYSYQGHPVYLQYPMASNSSKWPVVIFMHGMTLGWEYYSRHVELWASHGFVVAFPFVKTKDKDDGIIPVTETDATSIHAAYALLNGLANGTVAPPQGLSAGAIDVMNVGLAGHSMGGEDTIRAAAGVRIPKGYSAFPHGAVKVAVAQHPSLCTFPPPYPYTINKDEINHASLNQDLIFFTAESDRAFLPGTPGKEHTCWQAATGATIFASVKKTVCDTYPDCKDMPTAGGCTLKVEAVGKGHMCACDAPGLETWTSPELKWITAAMRLYLHFGNSSSSKCHGLLWGNGPSSLHSDPNMVSVESHGKNAHTDVLVV